MIGGCGLHTTSRVLAAEQGLARQKDATERETATIARRVSVCFETPRVQELDE